MTEEPELLEVDPHHPERTLCIGSSLHPREKMLYKQFLTTNTDVSWSPTDMSGIDPEVICHKLSIKADSRPVKQSPRRMNKERSRAISDEVDHLLQAGFIRETFYPNWLSNPVLKKKNGKWRVCIDFTNLNDVWPKDSYPSRGSIN